MTQILNSLKAPEDNRTLKKKVTLLASPNKQNYEKRATFGKHCSTLCTRKYNLYKKKTFFR